MTDCASRHFCTYRIYLRLPAVVVATGSVAVAEAPRIAGVRYGAIGKALAVLLLCMVLRRRMRMCMWAAIVGHVEALREAGRQAMGRRVCLRVLRRGSEGLLRGHDQVGGHSAAGRRCAGKSRVYATQGEGGDGVMHCGMACAWDEAGALRRVVLARGRVGARV